MRRQFRTGAAYFLLGAVLLLNGMRWSASAQSVEERIADVAVHGNVLTPAADIVRLTGLSIGGPLEAGALEAAKQRLEKSKRFESVEVLRRYRSLTDTSAVTVMLIVHERLEPDGPVWARPLRRLSSGGMFFPILRFADGYGLTYGARTSAVDALGLGERWSVPLTWGATRSAAVEVARSFKSGPFTEFRSTFGVGQKINPRFLVDDRRTNWDVNASRSFGRARIAGEAIYSAIRFGDQRDRIWKSGGTLTLDLRGDPAFPANGIYASGGWRALWRDSAPMAGIAEGDLRGYWRPEGHVVFAGRVRYEGSNRTLPDFERLLVGGASTLRGFRAGTFDGDRLITTSAEARILLPSPVRFVRLGAVAFVDAARAWDAGGSAASTLWSEGTGAGMFVIAPFIRFNLYFAEPFDGGKLRTHMSFGFTF